MSRAEDDRKRLIDMVHERREIIMDVDGYHYYWPSGNGHLAPHQLRWIADELDRVNAPWDAEVQQAMNRVNEREG